ncbi:MAG: TonB-dependent receptor [Gammaproteobacteria bacterium]|nr:TonB-dependent receptor [Gammaproteobacteria bacterium]
MASAPTFAAEQVAEQAVERIAVTGSRIKRVDMEGASPITVITAESLQKQGFATVADALRESNLNAFGSYGGGSNNSWGSQSTVQLKGASAQHTLTLLDGKRMAKSPVLDGGATNLNMIPMAAVERIEILTDGASAIYGSDAIAGVINIILKKDFEGMEIRGKVERPDLEGGDSNSYSITGGLSSDKGSVVFTIEHYDKDVIMMADRSFTKPRITGGNDDNDFQNWSNLSQTGRYIAQGGAGGWAWETPFVGDQGCDEVYGDNFVGALTDSNYPGDSGCAFNYTNAAALTNKSTRDNTMVNYTYEISDDILLTARAYWAKTKTLDISAPVPASISVPQGLPAYTTNDGLQLRELFADDWAAVGYRFDTAGDRIAEHHDSVNDYTLALEGVAESFDWDVSATYNNYTNFTWGTGYLLSGADSELVGKWDDTSNSFEGWDPRDPKSMLPAGAAANYDKRKIGISYGISGGVSFSLFELAGGEVGFYVGASARHESLDSKVDAQAEAGNIVGGNGGSGGVGDRDVSAVYFETVLPVLENLELNFAGRLDKYSDFGEKFTPQVSIKYNPIEEVSIRASYGEGFRAPTLSDLYQGVSEGYGDIINYVACYDADPAAELLDCSQKENAPTRTGGNKDLQPEESKSTNIGIVWDIAENIDFSFDYWTLETTGLLETIGSSEILFTQAMLNRIADDKGVAHPDVSLLYPGAGVTLLPNGKISHVNSAKVNLGMSERAGIDVNINATFELGDGDLDLGLNISKYLKYKSTYLSNGTEEISKDQAGLEGSPDLRVSFTAGYSMGDHAVTYYASMIGSQKTNLFVGDTKDTGYFQIPSQVTHSLSYNYQTPWSGSVAVGVNNLTNEEPKFNKNGGYNSSLYNLTGRTFYMSFSQRF